jgi:hypothetical protein
MKKVLAYQSILQLIDGSPTEAISGQLRFYQSSVG